MSLSTSQRYLFVGAFMLLALTNITVLTGIYNNRVGDPESSIQLSERELGLQYRQNKETSGQSLRLIWRALDRNEYDIYSFNSRSPSWLNMNKLEELGYHSGTEKRVAKEHKVSLPKEVFIVLENNGEAYKESLRRAKIILERADSELKKNNKSESLQHSFRKAEKQYVKETYSASRLFAIDAGLNPADLRNKYQDKTRFIITKGMINRVNNYSNTNLKPYGIISEISVDSIHVPTEHRATLDGLSTQGRFIGLDNKPPRYTVLLEYGKRFEPWITSIQRIKT